MPSYTIFCYICKKHITVLAGTEKDAKHEFNRNGHDDTKVRSLRPGLVGK